MQFPCFFLHIFLVMTFRPSSIASAHLSNVTHVVDMTALNLTPGSLKGCASHCNMIKTANDDVTACNGFYFSASDGNDCYLLHVNLANVDEDGSPREMVYIDADV